jgi:uncharacterized protein YprB with RNaseH-like and TPR domain
VLSSDLRARISELRRSAARRPISSNPEELETIGEGGLELPPPSVIPRATADDARIRFRLNDVIEGREAITPPGRFFLIDRDVDELLPRRGPELTRRFSQLIRKINGQTEIEHDEHDTFQSLLHTGPGALAFVDIEATGFTPGTPLFLVGLIVIEEDRLRVRQLLARDYTEEGALLFSLWKTFQDVRTVVSFNGKTYDLPYIRDRMVYYGYRLSEVEHIDLLHEGRRRYKDRLVNCKLQTLERAICGRGRVEDIPGAEIPEAYHNFVRTNNAAEMRDILHHNALDLVTMVEVVLFMLEGRTL